MTYRMALAGFIMVTTLLGAGAGRAAPVSYEFDELLSGDPSLAGIEFASLTVDRGTGGSDPWIFRLLAYDLSDFGTGAFLGALAFDGVAAGRVRILGTASGSGVARVGYSPGKGPGGQFDFRFDLTGPRKDRLTSGEWVEWTVSGLSSITGFGAHIQGIGPGGKNSAWYGSSELPAPIPLPATFWLVASALLGFAGVKRWVKAGSSTAGSHGLRT